MLILNNHFERLLPLYEITQDIDQITCPVFLTAGRYDYDYCPKVRCDELDKKPNNFTIDEFKQSGQYPNKEEPRLFYKQALT